jgi:hypothetical protein
MPRMAYMQTTTLTEIWHEAWPCSDCPHTWRCRQGMACAAFLAYTRSNGNEARWRPAPRHPDRDIYIRMYGKQSQTGRLPQASKPAPRVDTRAAAAERKRQATAAQLRAGRDPQATAARLHAFLDEGAAP